VENESASVKASLDERGIATITIDDGKVNALTLGLQAQVHAALDGVERDALVIVIRGRVGVFSAGFDLATLRRGEREAGEMVVGGFELARRVLTLTQPTVMASDGHAVAMGVLLLLAADYRIGTNRPSRICTNEVAIGVVMPRAACELMEHRLSPHVLQQSVLLASDFEPVTACAAGILDEVVEPSQLDVRVTEIALRFSRLDRAAHRATKRRLRERWLQRFDQALREDRLELLGH
jgi:enoyl-CoA hydratase